MKHRCNQILELGFPLGGVAKLFAQEWEGHVTVVMPATLAQYSKIIQNPSYGELQKAANQGRRCTWEKLSTIKANCGIELALDECVSTLNHMRRLRRSAQRAATAATITSSQNPAHHHHHLPPAPAKFSALRRIPSWNYVARENSSGSLDDETLADMGMGPSSSQAHRSVHHTCDGSDSDSESIDQNTWTRSGGPLMRTKSADVFVAFVQGLVTTDDEVMKQSLTGHMNSIVMQSVAQESRAPMTPNVHSENPEADLRDSGSQPGTMVSPSITITEGDLLQPERTQSGIVFNVVKKEDLTISSRSNDSESLNGPPILAANHVQLESPETEEIDVSSGSESDERDEKTHLDEGDSHASQIDHSSVHNGNVDVGDSEGATNT